MRGPGPVPCRGVAMPAGALPPPSPWGAGSFPCRPHLRSSGEARGGRWTPSPPPDLSRRLGLASQGQAQRGAPSRGPPLPRTPLLILPFTDLAHTTIMASWLLQGSISQNSKNIPIARGVFRPGCAGRSIGLCLRRHLIHGHACPWGPPHKSAQRPGKPLPSPPHPPGCTKVGKAPGRQRPDSGPARPAVVPVLGVLICHRQLADSCPTLV